MKLFAAGVLFLLLSVSSCTEFFSTTLAPWAQRDKSALIPPVTVGNVKELVETAEADPDLSFELLKKIEGAAAGADADDAASLQAAALGAASNATGLGSAIINQANELVNSLDDPDNAKSLIVETLNSMSNLEGTGNILTSVLPDPGTPEFVTFADKATAEDLAIAAALLLAGQARKTSDPTAYFNSFDSSNPSALNPAENMALELAKAASGKNDMSGRLKDLLGGLNLPTTGALP